LIVERLLSKSRVGDEADVMRTANRARERGGARLAGEVNVGESR
jgi:hypothetical protein